MTTGNKIRSGALWSFMGSTGSQIISFIFGIVLARMLAPEVFGMLLTIQVFTGVAGFIAGAGMGQALVRAKDIARYAVRASATDIIVYARTRVSALTLFRSLSPAGLGRSCMR